MTKQELATYPKAPLGDPIKEAQVNYVLSIMDGMTKEEAYAKHFPDRYEKIKGNKNRVRHSIYMMEQGEYVSSVMKIANKQAYSRFFGKIDKVLNRVYSIATDESQDIRDSIYAANTFLKNVPKAPDEVEVKVEIDIKDQYRDMLRERHEYMMKLANGDTIDVEVTNDRKE